MRITVTIIRRMGRMIAAAALAALVALPSPARAWGFEAHQFIVDARHRAAAAGDSSDVRGEPGELRRALDRSGYLADGRLRPDEEPEPLPRSRLGGLRAVPVRRAAARLHGRHRQVRSDSASCGERHCAVARRKRCTATCVARSRRMPARRVRPQRHHSFLRLADALRQRCARAVSRRHQLRRSAHRPERHPRPVRILPVRAIREPADDCAEADGADPRIRATSSSTRCCRGHSSSRRS